MASEWQGSRKRRLENGGGRRIPSAFNDLPESKVCVFTASHPCLGYCQTTDIFSFLLRPCLALRPLLLVEPSSLCSSLASPMHCFPELLKEHRSLRTINKKYRPILPPPVVCMGGRPSQCPGRERSVLVTWWEANTHLHLVEAVSHGSH